MKETITTLTNNETFYLGIGGNEEDSLERIKKSITLLADHPSISHLRHAHFYSTLPLEVESDRWFVNTVCSFQCNLSLRNLFKFTQQVETAMGKVPKPKTTSRPIDIDILFMGESSHLDETIEIPHPRWSERLFVLVPLSDLTPMITVSNGKTKEKFIIKQMIEPLLAETPKDIVLLEENPEFIRL